MRQLKKIALKLGAYMMRLSKTYYKHWLTRNRYGSIMESYIASRDPKNVHDVEYLALQYQYKLNKGKL